MMEKVFSAIVALTIGTLLVRCLLAMLWGLLHELGAWLRRPLVVLVVVFAVGAAVQLLSRRGGRDARGSRERKAEERFVRQSVRRPAHTVPAEIRSLEPDDDPSVDADEEEGSS